MTSRSQAAPRNGTDTKSAILMKAATLFSTKGYVETSMSDLAEELGLSKAAIYHHFDSKESLLRDLMDSTFNELDALVSQNEAIPVGKINLHDLLRKFAEITFAHRKVIRLVLSEMPAEMKARGHERHQCMIRLQKLLAGRNSTTESQMRAKAAIVIIASGILPAPLDKGVNKELDFELLLAIASDALGLKKR
jgi:AcrR family transcriptional regulator